MATKLILYKTDSNKIGATIRDTALVPDYVSDQFDGKLGDVQLVETFSGPWKSGPPPEDAQLSQVRDALAENYVLQDLQSRAATWKRYIGVYDVEYEAQQYVCKRLEDPYTVQAVYLPWCLCDTPLLPHAYIGYAQNGLDQKTTMSDKGQAIPVGPPLFVGFCAWKYTGGAEEASIYFQQRYKYVGVISADDANKIHTEVVNHAEQSNVDPSAQVTIQDAIDNQAQKRQIRAVPQITNMGSLTNSWQYIGSAGPFMYIQHSSASEPQYVNVTTSLNITSLDIPSDGETTVTTQVKGAWYAPANGQEGAYRDDYTITATISTEGSTVTCKVTISGNAIYPYKNTTTGAVFAQSYWSLDDQIVETVEIDTSQAPQGYSGTYSGDPQSIIISMITYELGTKSSSVPVQVIGTADPTLVEKFTNTADDELPKPTIVVQYSGIGAVHYVPSIVGKDGKYTVSYETYSTAALD